MPSRHLVVVLVLPAVFLVACGEGDDGAVTLATVVVPTTTAGQPGFPAEWEDYRQGDTAFGVYLAVERTRIAPELAAAKEELRRVGYSVASGETDINCDQGAREALRLAPDVDYVAVVVYFRTGQEAQQFVDAFQPGVVGTAEVKIFCADSGY